MSPRDAGTNPYAAVTLRDSWAKIERQAMAGQSGR